jgi:hypothetical protein
MEDSLSFDLRTQDVQKLLREAEDSLDFELRACQNTDKMEDSLSFENPPHGQELFGKKTNGRESGLLHHLSFLNGHFPSRGRELFLN